MAQTSINSQWSTALHPTLSQGHQVRLSYTWGSGAIVSIQILQHLRVPPEPRARGRQWAMDALRGWDQESEPCCTVKKLSFWFSWLSQVGKAPGGRSCLTFSINNILPNFHVFICHLNSRRCADFMASFVGFPAYWTCVRIGHLRDMRPGLSPSLNS